MGDLVLWDGTEIQVVRGDITDLDVGVVVNAANSTLLGGGGVDGAIHRAAGPELLAECRAVVARQGECAPGQAVMTGAGEMTARHVVHTVGPVWTGVEPEAHDELLASCYRRSLELAVGAGVDSIAFPNISTGAYRFPKDRAARVAIDTVRQVARAGGTPARVVFCCFDDENMGIYGRGVGGTSHKDGGDGSAGG